MTTGQGRPPGPPSSRTRLHHRTTDPGADMRYGNPRKAQRTYRNRLAAVTVACALLGTAGVLPGAAASAAAGPPRQNGAALRAALRGDLTHYLTTRHKAEHISAV